MRILATLAWRPGQAEGSSSGVVQDDLHIVIRKQLDNSNSLYKRMGVVGAVTAIRAMGLTAVTAAEVVDTSHPSQDTSTASSLLQGGTSLRTARQLLEMVKAKTRGNQEAAGLFLDEMANAVAAGGIDRKLIKWISNRC